MSEKQEQKNEDIREFGQVALNNNRENNRISLLTVSDVWEACWSSTAPMR